MQFSRIGQELKEFMEEIEPSGVAVRIFQEV